MKERSIKECRSGPNSGILVPMLAGTLPTTPPSASVAVRQHRLDQAKPNSRASAPAAASMPIAKSRDFTAADKALIRRVHPYMNQLQLLGILNTRLACDVGDDVAPYTIDQLRTEIDSVSTAVPAPGRDWGTLRKLLTQARRTGVLDVIDEQVINDFAVVFSLNQKQALTLKDIVLQREEEES